MTETDKQDIKFEEAYDLLEHMRRPSLKEKTRSESDWIIDSIDEVLAQTSRDEELENPETKDIGHELEENQREISDEDSMATLSGDNRHISLRISAEDYESGMKQWSEKTSTSPSGRNLSLYKSLLGDKDFTDFFRRMCELPVVHGFAPTRWAHALKLLLEKDPGSPRVSRLRAIYLLEADYNLVLRIIWGRRMM